MKLRALAPAKLNLCLFLGPPRADGRHELVTVFESLSLADELSLSLLSEGEDEVVCPGVEGPNLVAGALAALRDAGWGAPPVRIEIDKRIPVAAGLGGGSADAAATLRLAHAAWPLLDGLAERVARELGADVPSQLEPGLSLGTGAGEIVAPLSPLPPHAVLIVPQPFELSTAEVYREADRLGLPRDQDRLARCRADLTAALAAGATIPAELLVNDLAPAAVSLAPSVSNALEAVQGVGADQALVCGSGPTVAGIFWGDDSADRAGVAARELSADHGPVSLATPVDRGFGLPRPT